MLLTSSLFKGQLYFRIYWEYIIEKGYSLSVMISQHMFHWPMLEKNVESVMSYVEIVLKLYFLDVKIFFTFFIRLKPFF